MANYNLNDAKKIVYLDKNGEQQTVKEVGYIGSTGKYKVGPGDIYLTDIKIVDPSGYEYDLEYVNGEPTYKRNNITYTGLSPNKNYYIKGTLRVMRFQGGVNTLVDEIENCYPMHYTMKEYSGQSNPGVPVGIGKNEGSKYNPMVDMDVQYNVYSCTEDYSSVNDDNTYCIPTMGYGTPGVENGQVMLGLQGEYKDLGIKLKRIPITRSFSCDMASNVIMTKDETISSVCKYVTSGSGPNPGSSSVTTGFTVENNNPDKLQITHSNGQLMVKCLTRESGTYEYTVSVNAHGKSDYITKSVTTIGPSYRLQAASGPSSMNPGSTMTISADKIIVVYRASSTSDITNQNFTQISNFSLSSSDTSIVGISNTTLKPYKSGIVTITVTDNELNTSFDFTCKADLVNTDTYMDVVVDGANKVSKQKVTSSDYKVYVTSKCQMITISFYTTSDSNATSKSVYYEFNGNGGYTNMSLTGTASYTAINTLNGTTPYEFVCKLYTDSTKSNYIGQFTIDYL